MGDLGSLLMRGLVRLMDHQRLVNLLVSNVPGPPTPMYFAGARVLEVFQVGVIQGNLTLSVGMLSYAGQLNFDVVADPGACPDVAVFAKGLETALDELGAAATITLLHLSDPQCRASPRAPSPGRGAPEDHRGDS